MPKEQTLRKVEQEMETGQLGRARDRLHGLLATYPEDLELRAKLAEVYWLLQDRAMAGRYWYLQQPTDQRMRLAREAFEQYCGRDPLRMLLCLKFRGELEGVPEGYGRDTLKRLQKASLRRHGHTIAFGRRGRERYRSSVGSKARGCGCGILVLVALIALVAGLVLLGVGFFRLLAYLSGFVF